MGNSASASRKARDGNEVVLDITYRFSKDFNQPLSSYLCRGPDGGSCPLGGFEFGVANREEGRDKVAESARSFCCTLTKQRPLQGSLCKKGETGRSLPSWGQLFDSSERGAAHRDRDRREQSETRDECSPIPTACSLVHTIGPLLFTLKTCEYAYARHSLN